MKKILTISKIALASAAFMFGLNACDDAEYQAMNNAIYITEAMSNPTSKVLVDPDNGGKTSFSVSLSDKAGGDISARLTSSSSALDNYNATHGTNYKMFPAGSFSFSEDEIVIPAGSTISSSVELNVNSFTEEQQKSGDLYAIPITVQPVSSGFTAIQSIATYIVLLDQVIETCAPVFNRQTIVQPVTSMRQDYSLNEWSIEFRVNMSNFNKNNQAIIGLYPDEIYVRFGDAGKDYNMLQIKTQGTQYESKARFNANQWYHIAIVGNSSSMSLYVNGTLDGTLALSGAAKWSIAKDNVSMIGSAPDYFTADCMLSEVRFWTKAISQMQIQNYMFAVNPASEGLEAYWKMDEGSGVTFEDATGHGNTMTVYDATKSNPKPVLKSIRWQDGVRSDQQ